MNITMSEIRQIYKLARALDNYGFVIPSKIKGRLDNNQLPETVQEFIDELLDGKDTLAGLIHLFGGMFISGIQNGQGASVWFDDMDLVNLEVDILRVRKKIAAQESELQPLRCSNGTLCISTSAKIQRIIT